MQPRHLRPPKNSAMAIDDEISRPHLNFAGESLCDRPCASGFFGLGARRLSQRRFLFRFSSLPVSSAPFSFCSHAMLLPHSTSIPARAGTCKSHSLALRC
jgi:hypothetical protein